MVDGIPGVSGPMQPKHPDAPEVWDPETTPRRLTLFSPDTEDAPFVIAWCKPYFWQDGNERFYVPIMSAQLLSYYLGQCQAADPNGTWYDWVPQIDERDENGDQVAIILNESGDEHGRYSVDKTRAAELPQHAFDRLPWRDA